MNAVNAVNATYGAGPAVVAEGEEALGAGPADELAEGERLGRRVGAGAGGGGRLLGRLGAGAGGDEGPEPGGGDRLDDAPDQLLGHLPQHALL
jgi:hypothetical protein